MLTWNPKSSQTGFHSILFCASKAKKLQHHKVSLQTCGNAGLNFTTRIIDPLLALTFNYIQLVGPQSVRLPC